MTDSIYWKRPCSGGCGKIVAGKIVEGRTQTPKCMSCRKVSPPPLLPKRTSRKLPCEVCGVVFRSRSWSPPKCKDCRGVSEEERTRRELLKEARLPDYNAVDAVVLRGTSYRQLNTATRRLIIRRMSSRLLRNSDNNVDVIPGFITAVDLGRRFGVSGEAINATLNRLPSATRHICPECRGDMWVLDSDGTVEDHGNGFLEQCAMVGRKWLEASA